MERSLAVLTDAIITVSDTEYTHFIELGVPARKLFLAPNGINASDPKCAAIRKRSSPDRLNIGFVGRLTPQKNVPNLLQAFALLPPSLAAKTELTIAGDGAMASSLRARAAELGISSRVCWLGETHGRSAMAAFDIFALSSDYEALPYVLLEAMDARLPIVTTRVGGVGMLIGEGDNGFIVPPGRPDLMAGALAKLLTDPDLRRRMGQRSLQCVKKFTIDTMVNRTLAVYESVLAKARPSAFSYLRRRSET